MRLQNLPPSRPQVPPSRPAPAPAPANQPMTVQDYQLMDEIRTQERWVKASHAMPWTGAAVLAMLATQFSSNPWIIAGLVGPAGFLLGMGLAQAVSDRAVSQIEAAQAQLSTAQGSGNQLQQ
jgi:hypothetical protein